MKKPPGKSPKGKGKAPNPDSNSLRTRAEEAGSYLLVLEADVRKYGYVGDTKLPLLLYLIFTSRRFKKPVSIVIKGASSAGKSYALELVLRFFPRSSYIVLTSMSDKALVYNPESYEHRILYVGEAAGVISETVNYMIRSLLSEHRVIHTVSVPNEEGGWTTATIEKVGPICFATTTTCVSLNPENETRVLSYTVDNGLENTSAIFSSLADEAREPVDFKPWHNLQKQLDSQRAIVSIPFAPLLAKLVPAVALRQHRDFSHLLALIRSHAFLHYEFRERDKLGNILATLKDYAAVRELVVDLFSQQAAASVQPRIRQTVECVKRISTGNFGRSVMATEIAKDLKIDEASATRRVKVAIELEFLRNEEQVKGKPMQLFTAKPLPEDVQILPTVEELRQALDVLG